MIDILSVEEAAKFVERKISRETKRFPDALKQAFKAGYDKSKTKELKSMFDKKTIKNLSSIRLSSEDSKKGPARIDGDLLVGLAGITAGGVESSASPQTKTRIREK